MARLKVPKYDLNNFAVITVLFNPVKYKSRYEQYHKFDEHMSRSGVTLLTVECIFDCSLDLGLPRQKFEVTRSKDTRHLQITAPSVIWLKENLINMAIRSLPESIEYIAWLDADIEFERLDWPHLTIHQLQNYDIVQMFELGTFLGPSGKKQIIRQDYSFVYAMRHNLPIDPNRSSECYVHPGYGWAMRRSVFNAMNGLLDISILGAGEIHFAFALFNRIEETIPERMNDEYKMVACAWGHQVARVSRNGDRVGYVPLKLWHHWHGNRVNRGYFERWLILEEFQYSPLKDLEKNNENGLIRLKNTRNMQAVQNIDRLRELEKSIVSYFRSRDEDNIKRAVPSINPNQIGAKSKNQAKNPIRFSKMAPPPPSIPVFDDWTQPVEEDFEEQQQRKEYFRTANDEMFSLSFELQNDSFFNQQSVRNDTIRFSQYGNPVQSIYYEDEYGNNNLTSPGEISF